MGAGASVGLQAAPDLINEQLCQVLVGSHYYDAALFKQLQNEQGMVQKSDLLKITSQSDCYFLFDSDGKEGADCFADQLQVIEQMLVAKNLICWLDESRVQSNPHYRVSLQRKNDAEGMTEDTAKHRLKDPTMNPNTSMKGMKKNDADHSSSFGSDTEAAINHAQCVLVFINEPFVKKVGQKNTSTGGVTESDSRCRAEFNYACIHKTGVKMIPVILQSSCKNITEWTDALGIPPIDMSHADVFVESNFTSDGKALAFNKSPALIAAVDELYTSIVDVIGKPLKESGAEGLTQTSGNVGGEFGTEANYELAMVMIDWMKSKAGFTAEVAKPIAKLLLIKGCNSTIEKAASKEEDNPSYLIKLGVPRFEACELVDAMIDEGFLGAMSIALASEADTDIAGNEAAGKGWKVDLIQCKRIAELYDQVKSNNRMALEDLLFFAKSRDPLAEAYLSKIYFRGTMAQVPQDIDLAHNYAVKCIPWITQHAYHGLSYAQYCLGFILDLGIDTSAAQTAGSKTKPNQALKLAITSTSATRPPDPKGAFEWYSKAAGQGHQQAMIDVGYAYLYGVGVKKSETKGIRWYERAADSGYALAMCNLGVCYEYGKGVDKDWKEAQRWFARGADQGMIWCRYYLGRMTAEGHGCRADIDAAIMMYREAAELQSEDAQVELGLCYELGVGVEQDFEEAVRWYRIASKSGNPSACCNLAMLIEHGKGAMIDYNECFRLYGIAAHAGHSVSCNHYGRCFEHGMGVEQNYEQAFNWYEIGAEKGDAAAQLHLALCYEHGRGVKKNMDKALKFFIESAKQGNANACNYLGQCFEHGRGMERSNMTMAAKYYKKAVDKGHVAAKYHLGICYEFGNGVEMDEHYAYELYSQCAQAGNAHGQYCAGMCLLYGVGTNRDEEHGRKLLEQAAQNGIRRAAEKLQELDDGDEEGNNDFDDSMYQ